ncbi:Regulator of nonsense transcripts 1-like [Hondaea fermentalgiana]|uniref:Regulator of nonsense transcripts 1-like n=1 Tax=Hondaea fermentalgiana TaxID=2315210 RepID=A0A2R5G8D6_9STRA|nr:Regulator of nonsense transcripts 1-like [Hondaea fermentalgiana]|eukprot:GBG26048.1 Regulator of nonsense transcripts 1-like [Hondaea fermentalgiana]
MQGYGSDMVRINPSSLRDVPLSFRSSQEYAEVFLPLVLEDAFEEARASLRTGRIADRHCPCGAALHTRNESSTENTSDRLKPVMLRFVLHKYTCKSKGEVSQHEQEFGRLPRYDLARVAEADYLKAHGIRKHRTVAPSELSQGDVLILSSSRKYYDNRGVRTRDLAPTAALAVVHGSSRVSFARTPHAQDPTGRSYEIECLVPVTLPVKAELPSFVYGWRPSNCITSWREYDAVAQVVSMNGAKYPLLETLLDGKGKLSQAEAVKQQQQAQQNPTASGDEPADNVTVPGVDLSLLQYLESTYNPSQFKAIIKSAAKTKGFTLIQGPPGTGKTHTLLGIINLLHVSVFQRYYDSQLLSPHLEEEQIGNAGAPVVKSVPTSRLSEMDRLEQMPHILVTAPSNTAVDGMVEKIYSQQFRDGLGQMYIPAMVRIGKPTQGNHESASVYLDTQVEDLIRKLSSNPLQPLKERIQALELREKAILDDAPQFRHRAESLAKQIRQSKAASLKHLVWMENNKQKATMDQILEERHNEAIRLDQLPGMEADYRKFAQLFHTAREKLQACRLELSRCRTINSATSPASMRAKLRESVMEQAQIFFVTLSSSALRQIQELRTRFRFEVVVVDEAAQATEPSVLVPLQHHVDHCVLVGDPKQLPATVVSDRAASHYLQQSLFERLQTAGHPSYLLDTQYRCHPKISAFPSREFYAGRLKDGPNVLEPDYETPGIARFSVFNPLTFLNVSRARQSSSGDSFRNEDEAVLALNLYETLRFVLKKDELTGDVGIGIITPYREQLELLRSKFKDYRSDENLQLNTVDGFQGREFDVIILSCVRSSEVARHGPYGHASSSKAKRPSIGFVKDARRLNVAVTRAKFCLIVIGQDRTLRVSPLWARFLDHVHGTGSFLEVMDVHADLLHL